MHRRLRILLPLLLIASAFPAQASRLPPRDECRAIPGFSKVRQDLAWAVQRRDAKALLALTDARITYSFGDDPGRAGFIKTWKLDRAPAASPIWQQLDRVLALGCGQDGDGNPAMPLMFVKGDPGGGDPFETAVVTGSGVALRSKAAADAPVVARLDWDVVTLVAGMSDTPWQHVRTAQGGTGWVSTPLVRSFVDYRAVFARMKVRWRMTAFIAGD